jgi:hypothetical protein
MAELDKQKCINYNCNILFQFLDCCDSNYIWYPLRALAEFVLIEGTDENLSHRLNADNLLLYKQHKEMKTSVGMCLDFGSEEAKSNEQKSQDLKKS